MFIIWDNVYNRQTEFRFSCVVAALAWRDRLNANSVGGAYSVFFV